jgi:hypothetical protein
MVPASWSSPMAAEFAVEVYGARCRMARSGVRRVPPGSRPRPIRLGAPLGAVAGFRRAIVEHRRDLRTPDRIRTLRDGAGRDCLWRWCRPNRDRAGGRGRAGWCTAPGGGRMGPTSIQRDRRGNAMAATMGPPNRARPLARREGGNRCARPRSTATASEPRGRGCPRRGRLRVPPWPRRHPHRRRCSRRC